MATKWDPLVQKYKRRCQQELSGLAELRRHVRETEANRDKVAERQQHFRQQLNSNTRREIADWRVMKSFLADLDALRNNCVLGPIMTILTFTVQELWFLKD